jgi:hypothetical protein
VGIQNGHLTSTPVGGPVWVSGVSYSLNDVVTHGLDLFVCTTSHTASGSFLTDFNTGKWNKSSRTINYILNGSADLDTTGWSAFADAASNMPADGTGGTPNSTWTRTTSSPLRGFLWTKNSGASRQGEGVSYDFTIDAADKGKVLQGSFDYSVVSGTFADDAMSVWIYDVTNATMLQPAPYLIKNHSLAAERFNFEFQTSSSSTSYRLILYVPVSTDSANTLKFDNFNVGPQAKLYGSPVTDWVSFTPTGSWSANTTYTGKWRRVGDMAEYAIYIALAGAPTSADLILNLPSGHVIDTAKLPEGALTRTILNTTSVQAAAAAYPGSIYVASTTTVGIITLAGASSANNWAIVTATVPGTFANTDFIKTTFKVPISGWSSSVLMSGVTQSIRTGQQSHISILSVR